MIAFALKWAVVLVGNSNSDVPMVKPAQDWQGKHPPCPLDVTRKSARLFSAIGADELRCNIVCRS